MSYAGVAKIIRFNWPMYVTAFLVVIVAAIVATRFGGLLRFGAVAAVIVAAYFIVASIVASHIIYDRSPIYEWTWLKPLIGEVSRIVNITAGFDETTTPLRAMFGEKLESYAFGDDAEMEPSILRARRFGGAADATPFKTGALPLPDASVDAITLLFAAHEVRDPVSRVAFFTELRRALKPAGRMIVLEHMRDLANTAAYGPGAWHFFPRREWLRVAADAKFRVEEEVRMTPFVRCFVLVGQ